jgi:hypothetical protein
MNDPSTRAKDMKSMPCPKIFGPFPPFFLKKKENFWTRMFFHNTRHIGGGM